MLQRFNRPNLVLLVAVRLPGLSQTAMLCTQHDIPAIIQHVHKSMNSWVCLAEYATFKEENETKIAVLHQQCPAFLQSCTDTRTDAVLVSVSDPRHGQMLHVYDDSHGAKFGVLVIRSGMQSHSSVLLQKLIRLHRVCVAPGWSYQSEGRIT